MMPVTTMPPPACTTVSDLNRNSCSNESGESKVSNGMELELLGTDTHHAVVISEVGVDLETIKHLHRLTLEAGQVFVHDAYLKDDLKEVPGRFVDTGITRMRSVSNAWRQVYCLCAMLTLTWLEPAYNDRANVSTCGPVIHD